MKTALLLVLLCLALASPVQARWPFVPKDVNPKVQADLLFQEAYRTLTEADGARDQRRYDEALKLYHDAMAAYAQLTREHPKWQPEVVRFRLVYCNNQVEAMRNRLEAPGTIQPKNGSPVGPGDVEPAPATNGKPQDKTAGLAEMKKTAAELIEQGQADQAGQLLLKGLRLDPDNRSLRLMIGMARCRAGRFEDAIHLLEPMIDEQPNDAEAYLLLGTAYFGLGRNGKALGAVRQATELAPNMGEAHFNLARVLVSMDQPDPQLAGQHYRLAMQLGVPPDPELEALIR